jgi:hypothetical protein
MRAMSSNCTDCERAVLSPINMNAYVRRFEGVGIGPPMSVRARRKKTSSIGGERAHILRPVALCDCVAILVHIVLNSFADRRL